MHEQSPVANFINQYLFDPIARALGFNIAANGHAVPDHIVMILLVSLGLISFAIWLRSRLSVENPTRMQHLIEIVLETLQGLMKEVVGKDSLQYFPLIGTLAVYILCGNLLGLIPGFLSPTSNLNVTASCAVCTFVYYNYHGRRSSTDSSARSATTWASLALHAARASSSSPRAAVSRPVTS